MQWGLSTGRTITYPISLLTLYSIVAIDAASGMDAVQVCDVNTANNTSAIIFQMRLTQGDILPDNMTGFYWILTGKAQQWGYVVGGINTFTVTFLITYIAAFGATASGAAEVATAANTEVSELTNTGFTLKRSSSSNPVYWVAWGIQQWGYYLESQSDTDYRHFQIAFTAFLLPVLGKTYYQSSEQDGYVPYIEYLGSNNFLCGFGNNRVGNANVPIIVVGMQQWGLTEEAYLPTIDFPVAFTSVPAVVGTPIKDYATSENYFGNNSIESVTVSSFVPRQTNTNGGTKAGAIRYIAVGY